MATSNMNRKFSQVWHVDFELWYASGQTERQTWIQSCWLQLFALFLV